MHHLLHYNSGARQVHHLYLIHNYLSFAIAAQKCSQISDVGLQHDVTESHANPFVVLTSARVAN